MYRARPDCCNFGGKRTADRAAGQIGAVEPRHLQQVANRKHPIEMAVEHRVPALAAGEPGQGRDNDRTLAGQYVEKRDPARQPAKASEKAKRRSLTLLPDAAGKAVDFDGQCLWFAHDRPLVPSSPGKAGIQRQRASQARSPSPRLRGDDECKFRRIAIAYSTAMAAGWNGVSVARASRCIGCGHQRSSHSEKVSVSCGMTFSAKSLVLYFARSLPMLPNCKSSIRWPTLRLVATSLSCAATSSGEPIIT